MDTRAEQKKQGIAKQTQDSNVGVGDGSLMPFLGADCNKSLQLRGEQLPPPGLSPTAPSTRRQMSLMCALDIESRMLWDTEKSFCQ